MPDVGVHRFAPGDDQHQSAEEKEGLEKVRATEEREAVEGIEGREDLGVGCDRGAAQRGDRHEPQEHDRPEYDADARGALELDGE